ncbi:MAG: type IV pilus modification PilV family protein [Syntrophorhabdaceae bacterium]
MRRKVLRSTSGFTLLEVIIAFVLLATAVVIILQLFSADLRLISTSENYVWATVLVEEKMREALDKDDLKAGTTSETLQDGSTVETTISKVFEKKTRDLPIETLEIAVRLTFAGGRTGERSMVLRTMKTIKKEQVGRM